jgi:hypothetical protein
VLHWDRYTYRASAEKSARFLTVGFFMEGLADSWRRHPLGKRTSPSGPCEFDPRPLRNRTEVLRYFS